MQIAGTLFEKYFLKSKYQNDANCFKLTLSTFFQGHSTKYAF